MPTNRSLTGSSLSGERASDSPSLPNVRKVFPLLRFGAAEPNAEVDGHSICIRRIDCRRVSHLVMGEYHIADFAFQLNGISDGRLRRWFGQCLGTAFPKITFVKIVRVRPYREVSGEISADWREEHAHQQSMVVDSTGIQTI